MMILEANKIKIMTLSVMQLLQYFLYDVRTENKQNFSIGLINRKENVSRGSYLCVTKYKCFSFNFLVSLHLVLLIFFCLLNSGGTLSLLKTTMTIDENEAV